MKKVGYKIKYCDNDSFVSILPTMLEMYFNVFSHIEIYINSFLLDAKRLNRTLCLCSNPRYSCSFHFPKNTLENSFQMKAFEVFLQQHNFRLFPLVLHFKEGSNLKKLANIPNTILLENEAYVDMESFGFFFKTVSRLIQDSQNIKVCLDLGHLMKTLFSCNNYSDFQLYQLIRLWKDNSIGEFHIHGVKHNQEDHLPLAFFGQNPNALIKKLMYEDKETPFVLETKGVEIFKEGKMQVDEFFYGK